jgi:hypothetical protein
MRIVSDLDLLKEAFENSGLLKKPRHEFYYDQLGGDCAPWCGACKREKEKEAQDE